jgi:hypothetical protein
MKTRLLKGITVLGVVVAMFSAVSATTAAKADDCVVRRRVEVIRPAVIDLAIGPLRVATPCEKVVVVDRAKDHDWRWRRDRCR